MNVVVPLAGPDFVCEDGSIKGLFTLGGEPLVKYTLDSRPWASEVNHYSFILYDCPAARLFARDYIKEWYKNSSIVFISRFSRGAALSALAGLSVLSNFGHPLIIDLADIVFNSDVNIEFLFQKSPSADGIALFFESSNPQYSYLVCDSSGYLVEAAEKKVISSHASSGTYIFRNCGPFLMAVAHAIQNESSQAYRDLFYVCPLFNGVIDQGKQILLVPVFNVLDIKNF
jgi:hypothetical protein